jgi:hypothetical protein
MVAPLDKYAKFQSDETVVRDVLVAFCREELGVECPRAAFRFAGGMVTIKTTPLIKQAILQQQSALAALCLERGVMIQSWL